MIPAESKGEPLETGQEEKRPCRFCRTPLVHTFVDLGVSPLANSYLEQADLGRMEPFYPLHVFVCSRCNLVQLEEVGRPEEIFSDYAYFSSFSESWLEHARLFAEAAVERFNLDQGSRVVEIGSNDGYLLRFFKEKGIPVLGIEPALNVAAAARERGIETMTRFFDRALARELASSGMNADLVVGNNVLAHIPAISDLMQALKLVLKPGGVVSMEFPHLQNLIEKNQFDTIYHEHYSYFSLTVAERIFRAHGLHLYDAGLLETHGGSLRILACREENDACRRTERMKELLDREEEKGLNKLETYREFTKQVKRSKYEILEFLIRAKKEKKMLCGYGAPAKGNTLLNYLGAGTEFIDYTVDRSPHKQGRYLPGSRIPVYEPERIFETRPDYLVILPWNLKQEIMDQMAGIRKWGGKFVTLIPEVEVM